jgi:hypothetical protein
MTGLHRLLFALTAGAAAAFLAQASLMLDHAIPVLVASGASILSTNFMLFTLRPLITPPPGHRIFTSITAQELLEIMQKDGLTARLAMRPDSLAIIWNIAGPVEVYILMSGTREVIMYRAGGDGFAGGDRFKASADDVKGWNALWNTSRTFIGKDGSPMLARDLSLRGGVGEEGIRVFLSTCRPITARWVEAVLVDV